MTFAGERLRVLCDVATVSDHQHVIRIVEYQFPCGTIAPYLEVSEPGRSDRVRIIEWSTAVHALLNLGEMEIYDVGNREGP